MSSFKCKYCDSELKKVSLPDDSDWNVEFLYLCLNDECGYYKRGWDWMMKNYKVKTSYRYMVDTFNEYNGPMPVVKESDYKDSIIE